MHIGYTVMACILHIFKRRLFQIMFDLAAKCRQNGCVRWNHCLRHEVNAKIDGGSVSQKRSARYCSMYRNKGEMSKWRNIIGVRVRVHVRVRVGFSFFY